MSLWLNLFLSTQLVTLPFGQPARNFQPSSELACPHVTLTSLSHHGQYNPSMGTYRSTPSSQVVAYSLSPLIPIALPGHGRNIVANKARLKVVEDCELVTRHNIGRRRGLDLGPDTCKGRFQDVSDNWVTGTLSAVAGNLERLRN